MTSAQVPPGGNGVVTLSTHDIIVGVTTELQVTGTGFDDCTGDYQLTARINDRWRGNDPGQVIGTGPAAISSTGDFESTVPITGTFEGEWLGGLTIEGPCYGEGWKALESLRFVFATSDPALADIGIDAPEGAESATAFVVPGEIIRTWAVPLDRPDSSPEEEFDHISVWVGGELCDTADVAGGDLTSIGDAVVWVGLPSQPAACQAGAGEATFTASAADVQLLNVETIQAGLVLPFQPAPPAPSASGDDSTPRPPAAGSGANPAGALPLADDEGAASLAASEQGSDSMATTPGIVVLGGLVVAASLLAGTRLYRRRRGS